MNYLQITHEDVCNGDGLRVVLWLSGCSHHCYKCQNPQTWNPNSGIPFDESAKQEIFTELSKNYISGLTLTGGDPLHENNLDEVLSLIKEIRISFPKKTIWLYTGFKWNQIMNIKVVQPIFSYEDLESKIQNVLKRQEIIKMCDVLVDEEYIDEQKDLTLAWRGSKNQHVIDVQKSLAQNRMILYCE